MATGAQWRVGDAEREAVAEQLREHYAAGRLSIDEFRARLDAAYAAATADELSRVTANLPAAGPGAAADLAPSGPGPAGRYRAASPRRRRHRGRAAVALILAGLVTAGALALGSLPHGGLLVLAFVLVLLPVMLLAALAGAAVWIGRRAWRSGVWLEAVPVAVGLPWLARVVWMARAALVGRALWRAGGRAGRAVQPRRSRRPHGRYLGHARAPYQSSPGGRWHQARVGDLSGTTR
jgi:Domain of unknown function (DUF1707)